MQEDRSLPQSRRLAQLGGHPVDVTRTHPRFFELRRLAVRRSPITGERMAFFNSGLIRYIGHYNNGWQSGPWIYYTGGRDNKVAAKEFYFNL